MIIVGVFILAVPFALITTTIRVAVSEKALYDYSVRNYGAERASGVPESELIRANGQMRDYLVSSVGGPIAIRVTDNRGAKIPLLSAKETVHVANIRSLVQLAFKVQVISVALVLTLAVVMIALWPMRILATASLWGGLLTVAVVAAAGVLTMMNFSTAWTLFHRMAFRNNLWELNPMTDHFIQMYPVTFWQDSGRTW
jgi:integral membrane protein (TIGR01906 family)